MPNWFFNTLFFKTRIILGLSQRRFAEKLGVSDKTVSAIETNKTKPSVDLIIKFCEVYNYNIKAVKSAEKIKV